MSRESIEQLARALAETLPEGVRAMGSDLEQNFRAVLTAGIGKLDLVTREEFEVQQAVLARTREKLAALEARLAGLEQAPAAKKARKAKKAPARKRPASKKTAKKRVTKKKPG